MLFAFFWKKPECRKRQILEKLIELATKHAAILQEKEQVQDDTRRTVELIREYEESRDAIRCLVNEARKAKISDLEIEELLRSIIENDEGASID